MSTFKDGKENGVSKLYYENGRLAGEAPYINGIEDGIEKEYWSDGTLRSETTYKDGKVVKTADIPIYK